MLLDVLPATYDALQQGQLSVWHAVAMVEECGPLDRQTVEHIETAVLPGAGELTLAAFRRRLRRAVLKAQPEQAERAHEIAKAGRAVRLAPEADGMASVSPPCPHSTPGPSSWRSTPSPARGIRQPVGRNPIQGSTPGAPTR